METLTFERVASWERVTFATGPGDDVESAVRLAYREAGQTEPERVITLGSPAAGALAAAWLTGGEAVREALTDLATGEGADQLRPPGLEAGRATREGTTHWLDVLDGLEAGHSLRERTAHWTDVLDGLEAGHSVRERTAHWTDVLDGLAAGRSVREQIRTRPWAEARAAACAELGHDGWSARWAETGGRLWPQVERIVADVRRAVGDLGGDVLRRFTLDAVLGQHDAPWLAAFDGLGRTGEGGTLGGLGRVAGCAGWWWPFERVAIVTERPVEIHLDELGRLHRAEGPALAYPDGFALHAWHGMPVPADFGAAMTGLTPERIREEENAELRRAMLEHFGFERYLAESGARPMQSDEAGRLWRIELPDDEPLAMVEVVNSTPEPDGTSRTYFLRVPPWVSRARQGVAWTFGLTEEDYQPERET